MKPVLSTGDVAEYCQVSITTVLGWLKRGHLPAYTHPDGHHRILQSELPRSKLRRFRAHSTA